MEKYLLTFELQTDQQGKEIEIHGSPEGLENLANTILKLVKNTKEGHFNHDHLMTDNWGGPELTSTTQSVESELLNHVKLYCWKGSDFQA